MFQIKAIPEIFLLLFLAVLLTGILSCRHDSQDIELLDEVCFTGDILPIFQNSCGIQGCHDTKSNSEYIFTSFEEIQKAVVPGNPDASPAYKVLYKKWSRDEMMPPDQPLSELNRSLIMVWIIQGAKNTTCLSPVAFESDTCLNSVASKK